MADSNDSMTDVEGRFQLSHVLQLQKQAACFNYNHRVVTLVADNWRDSGYVRFALVLKTNWIRYSKKKLPSSSYNHNTLTAFTTFVRGHYKCISELQ